MALVCTWYHWHQLPSTPPADNENRRIYIGSETCEHLLPQQPKALRYCRQQMEFGRHLTLVTPLLSHAALDRVVKLIEVISRQHTQLEIVCNDWGLIHAAKWRSDCTLIAGRLIAMQRTDPRFVLFTRGDQQKTQERTIAHIDGRGVRLKYKPPSPDLLQHLRQSPLDVPETLDLLHAVGIRRFEISNLLQGIELSSARGWRVSLHAPEVVISVARKCLRRSKGCVADGGLTCSRIAQRIESDDFPVPLYHYHNAWFYANPDLPDDLSGLNIDRVIRKVHRTAV